MMLYVNYNSKNKEKTFKKYTFISHETYKVLVVSEELVC